jgi:hypothetical protein
LNETAKVAEHWALQPRARLLFSYAAAVTTILFALGVIANVLLAIYGTIPIPKTLFLNISGALLGILGACAAIWLWVGMCWYWVQLDHSTRRSKILWFLALLLTNWVGATAYYFLVYRRAERP